MSPRARARLISLLLVVLGLALAVGLVLYGLSGKITYFHTPSEIAAGTLNQKQLARTIRIGGMVKTGSLTREGDTAAFLVTDNAADLRVTYRGVLPDLFREGQGVVAYGRYDPAAKIFTASEILAKHDEKYMPPEVKKIMQPQ
jgi:cytochrome c-type biogenesis protein CcmE